MRSGWTHILGAALLALAGLGCGGDDLVCGPGQVVCGDLCVDLTADNRNCGACATACAGGEVCSMGTCATSCPPGQTVCVGACFDLSASGDHCGQCGAACNPGELCSAGTCGLQCPEPQINCAGGCFDIQSDRAHCGSCGSPCESGQVCSDGRCTSSCGAGQTECSGSCRDLQSDRAHCGTCGAVCAGGEVCQAGACVASCGLGLTLCDGRCVNTQSDRTRCGGCNTACGAAELCIDGSCTLSCSPNLTACDGACRDTSSDDNHCGACGVACTEGTACRSGACETVCGPFAPDVCEGVCTSIDNDSANCGACGTVCPSGEVCSAGVCANRCAAGELLCGGRCVNPDIDPAHCGACGTVCSGGAGATAVCATGICGAVCNTGFADCNRDLGAPGGNGCEVDLRIDVDNCGACGEACPVPANAVAACTAGSCGLGPCATGFADCDMDPANGCEANLNTSNANCGTCGVACQPGDACLSGSCSPFVPGGESCMDPLDISPGINSIAWTASVNDYIVGTPACVAVGTPQGPDIVLRYTPTASGPVRLNFFNKPTQNRWVALVSDAACGTTTPQLACISDWQPNFMAGTFQATDGTTYHIYVISTTSGGAPLNNPLDLEVADCGFSSTVQSLSPAHTSTTASLRPPIEVRFGAPIDANAGTFTLTGSGGTNQSLPVSGTNVSVAPDGTVTLTPTAPFNPGELITVTWTGVSVAGCTGTIAQTPWSFRIPVPPCTPGQGGMVGTTQTRAPTGITSLVEYYVAADTSTSGAVYVGGNSNLFRLPKAGGPAVDLSTSPAIGTNQLGFGMVLDGPNVYTIENITALTGRLWRLSSDFGQTINVVDVASFSSAPSTLFYSGAAYGGRIHMLTRTTLATQTSQLWSVTATATTFPTPARLDQSFGLGSYNYCRGLGVDDDYYYTQCRDATQTTQYAVVRVSRATGAVTELTRSIPGNLTVSEIHAVDRNADGTAEFLYIQGNDRAVFYICDPSSSSPFVDEHFRFGTSTTLNYGLGYDANANRLWVWEDVAPRDFIRVD